MAEKIHKVLADAGLGSRREIESWIERGRVTVNGRRARLGARISGSDKVRVDGRDVDLQPGRRGPAKVLMYHKPEGEICTRARDESRPTVFDRLPRVAAQRWVAVGRLDLNTSGLLLFTTDGALAHRLMHPSTGVEREYTVRVRGPVSEQRLERLRTGVRLSGRAACFERVVQMGRASGRNQWYRVVLREGRNREVRRLWEAVGCQVSRLKRIRYGSVRLPRNLRQGAYVTLAPAQLRKLLRTAGIEDRPDRRGPAATARKTRRRRGS